MPVAKSCLGVLGLAVALLAAPATVQGAFIARTAGNAVIYIADPGEVNNLTVGLSSGAHTFSDPGKAVDTSLDDGEPNECVNVGPSVASCPAEPGDVLIADLADQVDSATMSSPVGLTVCAGSGGDTLTGGDGEDFLLGEGGSDTITAGAANDIVISDTFCDPNQSAPPAGDHAEGGTGDDTLVGGKGPDSLSGGDDDDTLLGERVDDGAGGDAGDELHGGSGDDSLVGHDGNDLLTGSDGADILAGGNGDDRLLGEAGDDRLGVTVNQSFGSPVQRVLTTEAGTDILDGGGGNDLLNGGPGGFIMNLGLAGAIDPFETTAPNGPDQLLGGAGRDTVSYVNLGLPVRVTLDGIADDGSAQEGDNVGTDVEVLVGGSAGDTLIGAGGGDTIDGGKGDDAIDGAEGDDTLSGGPDDDGRDSISGGFGIDTIDGGPGDDSLSGAGGADALAGGGGSDTADGGDGADSVSGGPGLDSLSGGPGNDRLRGAAEGLVGADGADSLHGDEGSDDLDGGPGDDTLAGGSGTDVMAGADGTDVADYDGALGPVTVTLDGAPGDGEAGEGDHVLADVEGVRGGGGQDTLIGSSGPNSLEGMAGEDFIDGRAGADLLAGGEGVDVLRSRDRAADGVACGPSRDFAIADGSDRIGEDCEDLDDGGRLRPRRARSMIVRPLRGSSSLRLAYGSRFFPLQDGLRVPLRSSVEATAGTVRVTTARDRRRLQSATLSGGGFQVRQRRRRAGPTDLRMEGGSFTGCAGKRTVRKLRGHVLGQFRVFARHSTTAAGRASWLIEDRCDGTLTRLRRGRAKVVERGSKRTVLLAAGRSYLARRR